MSLKNFEAKWKSALTSILEELTEPQFNKLMFNLVKIPQGVKMGKTREEIPYIIIQYYGTEVSIFVIDKEMKQIPRNDAAVQEHLRPFVEKLKKQRQKEKVTTSKPAADSGSVAKKQKPKAETMGTNVSASGSVAKKQKPAAVTTGKPAADSGSVAKKRKPAAETMGTNVSASGSVAKKQKAAAVTTSKPAADSGSVAKKQKPKAEAMSMNVSASGSVAKKQKPAAVTTSKSAADSGSVAKKQKPKADPVGAVKPKKKTEKPVQSTETSHFQYSPFGASSNPSDMIDPVGVMEPKQETEMQNSFLKHAESTKTSKVQSAPVQTGRIKILKLKMSNKTNTHLEVEFNGRKQTLFITTRLLTNTLGFGVDDDLELRLFFELPLTADAKIQGNKIIEMKKM